MTDSFEQYRHEMTKKLAYEYWERKGRRPFGSPETDSSPIRGMTDAELIENLSDGNVLLLSN
jgi:hypothetical protein